MQRPFQVILNAGQLSSMVFPPWGISGHHTTPITHARDAVTLFHRIIPSICDYRVGGNVGWYGFCRHRVCGCFFVAARCFTSSRRLESTEVGCNLWAEHFGASFGSLLCWYVLLATRLIGQTSSQWSSAKTALFHGVDAVERTPAKPPPVAGRSGQFA